MQGAKDKDVLIYAKKNDLILITQDQKLSDMAEIMQVKCVVISSGLIAKIADAKTRERRPEIKQA